MNKVLIGLMILLTSGSVYSQEYMRSLDGKMVPLIGEYTGQVRNNYGAMFDAKIILTPRNGDRGSHEMMPDFASTGSHSSHSRGGNRKHREVMDENCPGPEPCERLTQVVCYRPAPRPAFHFCPGGCYPERCPRTILYGKKTRGRNQNGKSKYHYKTGDMVEWCGHKQLLGNCNQCGIWTNVQGMKAAAGINAVGNILTGGISAAILRGGMRGGRSRSSANASAQSNVTVNFPDDVVSSGGPGNPPGDGPGETP